MSNPYEDMSLEDLEAHAAQIERTLIRSGNVVIPDCSAWIRECVTIEDPQKAQMGGTAIIPFELWPSQESIIHTLQSTNQVIVLKARQLGISWVIIVYSVWLCIYHPGVTIIFLSKDADAAKEMVRRARGVFNRLKNKVVDFADPNNTEAVSWSNGSRIKSFAATAGAGASYTGTLVFLDEFGRAAQAGPMFSAVKPTVDDGGRIVISSTADDEYGELFEALYRDAMLGNNNFKPVFLSWKSRPSRTEEWYAKGLRDAESLGQTEASRYRQQYPSTIDEAFDVVGEDKYVTPESWAACYDPACLGSVFRGVTETTGCPYVYFAARFANRFTQVVLALDGSLRNDSTALFAIARHPSDKNRYALAYGCIWYPSKDHPVDFDALENVIERTWRAYASQIVVYDEYQLADIGQRLTKKRIKNEVFSQSKPRTDADTLLRELIHNRQFAHGSFEDLNEQVENANASAERHGGTRIKKRKSSLKIDALVTVSMGTYWLSNLKAAPTGGASFSSVRSVRGDQLPVSSARQIPFSGLPPQIGFGS